MPPPAAAPLPPPQKKNIYPPTTPQARASVEIKSEHPVRLADVQGLVLWTLADHICPRWVFLKVRLVRVVVVVVVGCPGRFAWSR